MTCASWILGRLRRVHAARLAIVTQSATRCCKNAQIARPIPRAAQTGGSRGACEGQVPTRTGGRLGFLGPDPDSFPVRHVLLRILEEPSSDEFEHANQQAIADQEESSAAA